MPRTHQSTAPFERGTPSCRRRPLRYEGAGDLGPAKAESSARWRARRSGIIDPRGAGFSCPVTAVSETGRRAVYTKLKKKVTVFSHPLRLFTSAHTVGQTLSFFLPELAFR